MTVHDQDRERLCVPKSGKCQDWCDLQDEYAAGYCRTAAALFEDETETTPAFFANGGPKTVARLVFEVTQDDDDERPLINLNCWETTGDDPVAVLYADPEELKKIHARLGALLERFA
ncbi:hypothetical protein J2T22_001651 [Pseudarthrobacter defluvii]|uniref:Uncharacterized protein n=1 Tax=Pseudarthrobacter defluvii TaxID=410837 RepID=A0ABT9UFR3_9MICC|nr:hypothetical protein [Pseudarthrobacter defluvii]MDQ0118473.1 hypothetical protein [Pseudarthrobacter defluvii]